MHAHNTFDQPQTVVPRTEALKIAGGRLVFTFPASVSALSIELG
jgi:hypothetical protein